MVAGPKVDKCLGVRVLKLNGRIEHHAQADDLRGAGAGVGSVCQRL